MQLLYGMHKRIMKELKGIVMMLLVFSINLLLLGCEKEQDGMIGYIEGEYRYIAAPSNGWLYAVNIKNGDAISQDQLIFDLSDRGDQLTVEQAKAMLDAQQAQVKSLQTSGKNSEITAVQAQLRAAQAQLILAEKNFSRFKTLWDARAIAKLKFDEAKTQLEVAQANVDSLQAQLNTIQSPARQEIIEAADANYQLAESHLNQAQWKQSQRSVKAQFEGTISQVFFHTGEFVTLGQPIAQVLLPQRKVIFYVTEQQLAQVAIGNEVTISSMANPQKQIAIINYIAPQASYTPPVIYSNTNSNKLTYRIEATLQLKTEVTPTIQYHVGQPIKVYL